MVYIGLWKALNAKLRYLVFILWATVNHWQFARLGVTYTKQYFSKIFLAAIRHKIMLINTDSEADSSFESKLHYSLVI